jgi:hypothetical protein
MMHIYCPKCGIYEDAPQLKSCDRCEIEMQEHVIKPHETAVIRKSHLHVVPDINPYQSMVDGTMIEGRKNHREHLKRHSLIEIGNETKHLKPYGNYKPTGIKEELVKQLHIYKDTHR